MVHKEGGVGLRSSPVDASVATSDVSVNVQGDVPGGVRSKFIRESVDPELVGYGPVARG